MSPEKKISNLLKAPQNVAKRHETRLYATFGRFGAEKKLAGPGFEPPTSGSGKKRGKTPKKSGKERFNPIMIGLLFS